MNINKIGLALAALSILGLIGMVGATSLASLPGFNYSATTQSPYSFYRSSTPITNTYTTETLNGDGSVTVTINSGEPAKDYGSGVYYIAGTLGELVSAPITVSGTGEPFAVNLWINTQDWTWIGNTFNSLGSDGVYGLGSGALASVTGSALISGTSGFDLAVGATCPYGTYTVEQLMTVCGLSSNTPVEIWEGTPGSTSGGYSFTLTSSTAEAGQVTATAQIEAAPQPVCALGLNNNQVTFPTPLYGGETLAPMVSTGITVTNESTTVPYIGGTPPVVGVSTGVKVSGTNWVGVNPAHTMSVGQTGVLLGTYSGINAYTSQFPLAISPSGDIVDLAPSGSAQLLFGLSVPTGQAADTYSQTISVETTC